MAGIKIEDLDPNAGLRRLTGDTGVFIGGDGNDLAVAQERYQAQKAYSDGTATPEQVKLLQDLDRVLQGASRLTPAQTPPPPVQRQYPPATPVAPVPAPVGGSALARLRAIQKR
mgnify:CR=1 FL=1